MEEYGRAIGHRGNIIKRMRSAYRLDKATVTHSEYVILTASPAAMVLRTAVSIKS